MKVSVHVDDRATPAIERIRARLTGLPLMKVIGLAAVDAVRRHLIRKDAQPNNMSFPKTGFYGKAASATTYDVTATSATVKIDQIGMRQRYHGGTIRPVNAKALTIPVHPAAYGRRAGEIAGLTFVPIHRGRLVGVLTRKPKGKAIGEAYYLLVRSVTQEPDPSVIPDPKDLATAAIARVSKAVDAL
jgi:hypothetical protein